MYSYKNVLQTYAANLHQGPCSLISAMHSLSTTSLITLPRFPLLNCKRILQLEFLNDTFIHMQLEVLNIVTFKIFKTKFSNFQTRSFKSGKF